ncbi:hypothetical protein HDU91_004553, partial [Kappamyces sp. JEL0680]
MCRQLKTCCGMNQVDMVRLWNQVLEATGGQEAQLSLFNIEDFWAKTLGNNPDHSSKGKPAKKRAPKRSNDNDNPSDTEYSDAEPSQTRSSRKRSVISYDTDTRSDIGSSDVTLSVEPRRASTKKRLSLDTSSLACSFDYRS